MKVFGSNLKYIQLIKILVIFAKNNLVENFILFD
jgi:hypothetical protein